MRWILVWVAVVACTQSVPTDVVATVTEPPGANCPNGGVGIESGPDENGNGQLDPDEISSTTYVCNPGAAQLVRVADEPPGANCAHGGKAIETGADTNGNGVLDDTEVTSTSYVCDPAPGQLVRVDPEPPGNNCASGGQAVHIGPDTNGNGVLDQDEVATTSYVCFGAPSVIAVVHEPPGLHCTNGGQAIQTGPDTNLDGVLESSEVNHVSYVCDAILRIDPEPPGANCSGGGTAIHVGIDDDHDGTLEDAEIQSTTFICGTPPQPNVIYGDYAIHNSLDVALLDGVTTITGNVTIGFWQLTDLQLPALQHVGGALRCDWGTGGCSNLASVELPVLVSVDGGMSLYASPNELSIPAYTHGDIEVSVENMTVFSAPLLQSGSVQLHASAIPGSPLATVELPQFASGYVEIYASSLTTLDLPAFVGGWVTIANSPNLTTVSLPNAIGADVGVGFAPLVTSLSFPKLESGHIGFGNLPALTTLSLPVFSTGAFYIGQTSLQHLDLPAATHLDRITIEGNPMLTSISAPQLTTCDTWFWIKNNPMYATCAAQALAAQAHAPTSMIAISGNDDAATCP